MLNKEQKLASEINHSRVLVLAGPGTGKTTTLISRYKHLINTGAKPEEIICCTFSRKASDEIKSRIVKETDIEVKSLPIGTFHSLARRTITKLAHTIGITDPKEVLTDKNCADIINKIKSENKELLKDLKFNDQLPSNIMSYINGIREKLIDPEDAAIEASETGDKKNILYAEIYKKYEEYLTENQLVDFPRMIQYAYKAFANDASKDKSYISQFKHVLIDEYQDINFSQKSMVDQILKGGACLWVVGDDDQAIYGWRGSSVKFILDFERDYPDAKLVVLNTNYRSENKIVIAANNLAKNFLERHEKNIISFGNDEGEVSIFKNDDEKLEGDKILSIIENKTKTISFKDIAILARTNTLPSTVVNTLSTANIPMVLKDNIGLFNEPSTKDLLAAAAIAGKIKPMRGWNKRINPKLFGFAKKLSEEDNWVRNLKSLASYIVKNLPSNLKDDELENKAEEIENCRKYLSDFKSANSAFKTLEPIFNPPKDQNGVHIGTIHGAKGLEWDTVIVMGCEDDKLPHSNNSEFWEIEEERRIAYVAITRPRTNLYMTWAAKRDGFEKFQSPYLNEMLGKKTEVKKAVSENVISDNTSKYLTFQEEVREFKEQQHQPMSQEERQRIAELIANNRREINTAIADGLGKGGEWKIRDTGNGFLYEVGYTAIKDGPGTKRRHQILADVFHGKINMPATLKEAVAKTWGDPMSKDRLRKMRNTINTALGAQKGKRNASLQAIEKWEEDLNFIDNELKKEL